MYCSICSQDFSGYGHNAQPIRVGRCCDLCNLAVTYVRIRQAGGDVSLSRLLEMEDRLRDMRIKLLESK